MPRRKHTVEAARPRPAILRPLGAQLRRLRLERELSQEELAELSGLNYKYIGRVELAKAEPGADVLVRLARALRVTVGELFETITPSDTANRLSPADLETMTGALSTITSTIERLKSGQPRSLPSRAPRRSRR